MDSKEPSPTDYDKPVAYDAEGRPLYAHPSIGQIQPNMQPQAVQLIRPTEPEKQVISEEVKLKHEQSKRDYPECDLGEGEYIIICISRHPIGLLLPLVLGAFLITVAFTLLFNFDIVAQSLRITDSSINSSIIILPTFVFIGLVLVSLYIAYHVYANNKLFLTNDSMIQEIQTGIFSTRKRMVSLDDIEDVSYTQNGIIQQIFNFGLIRLSTKGEGTVYYFKYVANPKEVIARLNNAVESYKNGRAFG